MSVRKFFACGCLVVPVPFFFFSLEKDIFSPLYCLYSFVDDQVTIFVGLFLGSVLSHSLICLFFCQ